MKDKEPKPAAIKFPLKGKINRYGFLHFKKDLLTHLLGRQWVAKKADVPVVIEEAEGGGVIVRITPAEKA